MAGEHDISDYWRLCAELSIVHAALLVVGVDPSSEAGAYCEICKPPERPKGYDAARNAIATALGNGAITGKLEPIQDVDINGNAIGIVEGSIDLHQSKVDFDSLCAWLASRGIKSGFFFPAAIRTADYLDPDHPRYSPKLAATVHAWQAVTDPVGKTPKQALEKWLRENAARFGLVGEDGNPVTKAMEECSTIANWQTGGGAPKTPGG